MVLLLYFRYSKPDLQGRSKIQPRGLNGVRLCGNRKSGYREFPQCPCPIKNYDNRHSLDIQATPDLMSDITVFYGRFFF
jgi:hypothetical protein